MTDTSRASNEAQIRAVIDDRAAALRAKNAAGVIRHHSPAFVHFSLAPPLVSAAADSNGLETWFATWRGPLAYDIHHLEVTTGGDAAFCHSLTRLRGTTIEGETSDIWFRQTLCFRKIGVEWKITHEHESVPFYMDGSVRAAVDLQP